MIPLDAPLHEPTRRPKVFFWLVIWLAAQVVSIGYWQGRFSKGDVDFFLFALSYQGFGIFQVVIVGVLAGLCYFKEKKRAVRWAWPLVIFAFALLTEVGFRLSYRKIYALLGTEDYSLANNLISCSIAALLACEALLLVVLLRKK